MKTLFSIAVVALVYFLHVHSSVMQETDVLHRECCPTSSRPSKPLRDQRVKSVAESNCTHRAIIVKTVCDVRICLDPTWRPAQNLLARFNQAAANSTAQSPFGSEECVVTRCAKGARCRLRSNQ